MEQPTASLAQSILEMEHDAFMSVLKLIFSSLLRCLEGLQAQSQVILKLLPSE